MEKWEVVISKGFVLEHVLFSVLGFVLSLSLRLYCGADERGGGG
jgi:hypothetical protein